ncbi:MAG: 30S ribosomal protein S15 [Methanothrix sp.]|jgi:small subunit ribosomal protein S15|uniref:30S ribosomal protein S15 n=1 Tax=Methanothrix sp. TaxID=90426 RepID=UPI003D28883D
MARMHSRKKGSSRSRPPLVDKLPEWCDVSKEELEKTIMTLHERGMSTAMIGLTLRDQYGVPNVKMVLGKGLSSFLRERNALPEIPEDLSNLMRKALGLRRHLLRALPKGAVSDTSGGRLPRTKDIHNKRALQLVESKIRRLVKYYKRVGRLPATWDYRPEAAEIQISSKQ